MAPKHKRIQDTDDDSSIQTTDQVASSEQRFDNIESVYEHLGGGGRYNVAVLILMMLCKAFPGMITLSPNFTAAGMQFNCSEIASTETPRPGDNCTLDPGESQQCWLVYNCSSGASAGEQVRFPCRQFSFHSEIFQSTTVSYFGLVCDRAWMAHLSITFFFVGFLIGCSLYGALADRFGRLRIILVSALNLSLCTTAASLAPFLWLYWTLQLLAGIGNGGLLTCLYTYALENTDTKHRSVWGFLVHNGWTLGVLAFTLMAYFERNYQRLLLYAGLSVLLLLLVIPFLSESPRWLVSTGRFEQADRVFRRIGRINGRPLGPGFSSRAVPISQKVSSASATPEKAQIWHLFSRPGIRKLTLLTWFIFFGVSMAYFGLSLSVDSLGDDIFINQIVLASVELPSRLLCLLLSFRLGRRPSIVMSFGLAALALIATGLLMQWRQLELWRVVAAMIGKFWITMSFDLAWLYSAEVFPTVLRSVGVGSGSTLARAGALLSTQMQSLGSLWSPLPFLVFAAGPLAVAALALLCLPETRGQRLPDSVDEGDRFARGQLSSDVHFEGPSYETADGVDVPEN